MKFEKIKVKVIFCGILFCIKTEKLNMESYRGHNGQSRNRRADGLFFSETPANHPGLFRFKSECLAFGHVASRSGFFGISAWHMESFTRNQRCSVVLEII